MIEAVQFWLAKYLAEIIVKTLPSLAFLIIVGIVLIIITRSR